MEKINASTAVGFVSEELQWEIFENFSGTQIEDVSWGWTKIWTDGDSFEETRKIYFLPKFSSSYMHPF